MWFKKNTTKIKVPVEISARHCHLSQKDLDALFGVGYELKKIKQLGQPSDFACEETVSAQLGSKTIEKIRVVGPVREKTQVEISLTDAVGSGIVPPVKPSGDLGGSASVALKGPAGQVGLSEGLIVAKRHLHCATNEAEKFGLKNGLVVRLAIKGERPVVFEDVSVRVKDGYKLCVHLDTDEGNAAGINKIGQGEIIK